MPWNAINQIIGGNNYLMSGQTIKLEISKLCMCFWYPSDIGMLSIEEIVIGFRRQQICDTLSIEQVYFNVICNNCTRTIMLSTL